MSDEKLDELIEVLRKHFPTPGSSDPKKEREKLVEIATLLKLSIHGGNFVERVPSKLQREVKRALQILNNIDAVQHFERKNINDAIRALDIIATAETLHGTQHTTRHRDKVAFAKEAAHLWTRRKGKTPPSSWLGDTHPYAKFLTDLINVLEPDWTARMIIDALEDYKISKKT